VRAAFRIGPNFILGNIMWGVLTISAWQMGLLAPFFGADVIEQHLLMLLGVVFVAGQCAILVGAFGAADRVAQFLPRIGLGCFILALLHLGANADLASAAGKAAFARAVIECMGLTCAAVLGMVVLESIIWIVEGQDAQA
jgi:hypothetical protein